MLLLVHLTNNKSMKNLIYIIVAVFISAMATSCDKESLNHENATTNQLKSSVTHLEFADTAAFLNHLKWVENNISNPNAIIQYNQNKLFTSLMEIYEGGSNVTDSVSIINYIQTYPNVFLEQILGDGSTFYDMPYSAALAYILNQNGEVQIGTQVGRWPNYLYLYSYRTEYWTSRVRLVGRLYENPDVANTYKYEVRTTAQKKVGGIWWQTNVEYLVSYNAPGTYYEQQWDPYTIAQLGIYCTIKQMITDYLFTPLIRLTLKKAHVLFISQEKEMELLNG